MSEASPRAYPFSSAALRPSWSSRRSQALAAVAVLACGVALAVRAPIRLVAIDDVSLRTLLPAALAFVLAFAPAPGTRVGRIARDLTVLGLVAAMFAGDRVPVLLACYPVVLMIPVAIDWAGRRFAPSRGPA